MCHNLRKTVKTERKCESVFEEINVKLDKTQSTYTSFWVQVSERNSFCSYGRLRLNVVREETLAIGEITFQGTNYSVKEKANNATRWGCC